MNTDTQERHRRILLSTATEPGDAVTAALVARLGTTATLRAARGEPVPELATWPTAAITAWQQQITHRLDSTALTRVLAACERTGIEVLIPGDEKWPPGLDDLAAVPLVLYTRGEQSLLARPLSAKVAVVGTNSGTGYGDLITQQTVSELAAEGFTIVSGASIGIEAATQHAALAAGGASIAVLARGLDRRYPEEHQRLIDAIATNGTIVSEMPPGATSNRWRTLQRGRIIAATAAATVVVEAGRDSGALNVAYHARNIGRPIAAFPGLATSPSSEGSNELIAHGAARLVTRGAEIRDIIDADPRTLHDRALAQGPGIRAPQRQDALADFSNRSRALNLRRPVHGPAL